jgi:hypothetical protein
MEKDTILKLVGILLIAISVLIVALLVVLQFQTLNEACAELALIFVGSIAAIGLKLLVFPEKSILEKSPMLQWTDVHLIKSARISDEVSDIPNLSHLNIHYSRRGDTADKPHGHYYVANIRTKKAYWVRPELLVLNRRLIIHSNTHKNETELRKYFEKIGIEIVERNSDYGELF